MALTIEDAAPTQERWQLGGDGPESYERYQVPSVFEPLGRIFLDRVGLRPGESVLDVACGTGIVARLAATMLGPSGRVAGIDLNPGMLAVAARRAPKCGAALSWHEGDATILPFPDAAFDVVLCQQGLQFFPDKETALCEMHRVLVPGGRLGICVWRTVEHSPCIMASAEALSRHVGDDAAKRIQAPFALGDPGDLGALIADAGFGSVDIHGVVVTRRMLPPEESIPGHLASTPVAPDVAALEPVTRARLIAEIAAALRPYCDREGLAIPQGAHVAIAVK